MRLAGYEIDTTIFSDSRVKMSRTEIPLLEAMLEESEDGDILYDVGANVGTHCILLSHAIDYDTVYCFEPHPDNIRKLGSNLEEKMEVNWVLEPIAAFDSEGYKTFDTVRREAGEGHGHVSNDGEMTIECDRLENRKIAEPDVVKIDVEGAELRVLEGMGYMIDYCRAIFIEVHPGRMIERYGDSIRDITQFAIQNGLKMERLHTRGSEFFIKLYYD